MRTIHKYTIIDNVPVQIPMIRKFLSVQMQGDNICLWVDVDPDRAMVDHFFRVFGTGEEIEEDPLNTLDYIGTVQFNSFVWHVYYQQ